VSGVEREVLVPSNPPRSQCATYTCVESAEGIHPVMTSKLDDGVSCDIGYCKDGVCMDAFGDP
jgi:hypothetical protein